MKILNTVVCLLAFCAVNLVVARPTGGARPAQQNQPVTPPANANQPNAPQQQAPKVTYKERHDLILRQQPVNAFAGGKFTDEYIAQGVGVAKANDLGEEGLRALLQTARDKWAPFTGNDADDLGILKDINKQIDDAVAAY